MSDLILNMKERSHGEERGFVLGLAVQACLINLKQHLRRHLGHGKSMGSDIPGFLSWLGLLGVYVRQPSVAVMKYLI